MLRRIRVDQSPDGTTTTTSSAGLYAVAAATGVLAVAAYVVTRATALPGLDHDVGNWFEPLGVVAILAETAMVLMSASALAQHRWGAGS